MTDSSMLEGLTMQQAAAFGSLRRFLLGDSDYSMAVLRGFAGTGKTYLVSKLMLDLSRQGIRVAIAAPTNKAVRVLREKIMDAGCNLPDEPIDPMRKASIGVTGSSVIEFGSIHSLLGLQLSEREDGTQECKSARDPSLHEYDAVIIDECSMIGEDLFRRIVTAKRDTQVLFVGDPAQLPPVEPGENVSPTFEKVAFEMTLSEVVRQASDNPIIKLSMMIRGAIENNRRLDAVSIASALPPLHEHPHAAMVAGGGETVVAFTLAEIREGRDARVLAFTNAAVQTYNRAIHESLYGVTERPFVAGEPVIVHSQCDAMVCDDNGYPLGTKTSLITSEEATIHEIHDRSHPIWSSIPSSQVILKRDNGSLVGVYLPDNPAHVEQMVSQSFSEWRRLKALANEAYQAGQRKLGRKHQEQAKEASSKAWAIRRAFAPLRHAYALTSHKSQGSTFDTAIVDFNDLSKIRSSFAFNRAVYVCATRPRQYLAIVA